MFFYTSYLRYLISDGTTAHNVPFKLINGSLILNAVKTEDDGEYECTASNVMSPPIKKKIRIKVKSKCKKKKFI